MFSIYNFLTVNFGTEMIIQISKLKIVTFPYKIFFDESNTYLMASISKYSAKNCKTYDTLSTHNSSTSDLTGHDFSTKTFENLTCKSSNVVYEINCNL
jgi:hypothetical protein